MRKVDPIHRKARIAWNSQMQRCNNPKVRAYENYGGRGIKVEYSFDEFLIWFLQEFKKREWTVASVGRIDHSKNYSLDNIEMVEHAENAREMYLRTGGNATVKKKPVVLVGKESTHTFATVKDAARFAKVTESYICLRKRTKADPGKKTKFPFEVFDLDDFLRGA